MDIIREGEKKLVSSAKFSVTIRIEAPNSSRAPAPTDVITDPFTGRKWKRGYPNYSFKEFLLNVVNRFIAHTFIQEEEGKIVSEDDLNSNKNMRLMLQAMRRILEKEKELTEEEERVVDEVSKKGEFGEHEGSRIDRFMVAAIEAIQRYCFPGEEFNCYV